jgi:GNAT superfamily N-acetyltransferase
MVGEALSDSIVIASATREDAPELHAMLYALAVAHNRPESVKSTVDDIARYGFGPSPAFETFIARQGEKAVGFATYFYEFSTWRGCPGVYVQDLFVEQHLRGAGIGRRLLAAVSERARRRDACYMRLAVHAANERAIEFYRRLGFAEPNDHMFVLEGDSFPAMGRE